MGFVSDLKFGEKYQQKYLSLLQYDEYQMVKGKFKPWDIRIVNEGVEITFEVKADRMTNSTKNIAIEYNCNNQDSGIITSTADYWIYFVCDTNKYYEVPRQDILAMIESKNYHRTVRGGDGWKSKMYLFNESDFSEYLQLVPESHC